MHPESNGLKKLKRMLEIARSNAAVRHRDKSKYDRASAKRETERERNEE